MNIPLLDLGAQYRQLRGEMDIALQRVFESGQFVGGPEGEALELELARYLGVPEVVCVNSGTDALVLSLRVLEIGVGDEVIVPTFTFFATAEAVSMVGARPVFADCARGQYNLDVASLESALTPRTKAVIVVHLFGEPVDLAPIMEFCAAHGLRLIEDAAQAIGASYRGQRVGSFGDTGAFSFYPTKNLGAQGDGGAISCRDPALAERLRRLRNHGRLDRYRHEEIGYNSRLDEIQAAALRIKLPHLDGWNAQRQRIAARYWEGLGDTSCGLPPTAATAYPVYHQFVVTHPERDALQIFLTRHGVATAVFYPIPCHLQPAFAASCSGLSLPLAERLSGQVLALPIYPELPMDSIDYIVDLIHTFERSHGAIGGQENGISLVEASLAFNSGDG